SSARTTWTGGSTASRTRSWLRPLSCCMNAAFMQFQRHGWDNHAVSIRHEAVLQRLGWFLRPMRSPRCQQVSGMGVLSAGASFFGGALSAGAFSGPGSVFGGAETVVPAGVVDERPQGGRAGSGTASRGVNRAVHGGHAADDDAVVA